MSNLLERHPEAREKIGLGVAELFTGPDAYGGRCFFVRRVDGSETDFSFLQCVDGEITHEAKVRKAARVAVAVSIQLWKQQAFAGSAEIFCPLSGELLSLTHSHVDHEDPTFDELFRTYFREPVSIVVVSQGTLGARFADPDLEQRWLRFHDAKAKLRLLSPKANLARPRTRVRVSDGHL